MEIDGCLTGLDLEATQKDLDKNLKAADVDFERATKLTPDYGEAWSNRGSVHALQESIQTGFPSAVPLLVLAAYTIAFGWLALRYFKWE